jgi:ubiquinone/menaquinone biosynthesis C-methylase UbiE
VTEEIKWNSKGYVKFSRKKASEYDTIARKIFAPIYPVIAGQMVESTGIREGLCLDIGTGPGDLAIAIAKITDCRIYAMDFSIPVIQIASAKIHREGLNGRVQAITGDVHKIPFRTNTVDLVVSRGSIRFWRNRPAAVREIARVLKPGGKCRIGGGLGSREMAAQISQKMRENNFADWTDRPHGRKGRSNVGDWKNILYKAGIARYGIVRDDSGFWISFEKEE